MTSIHVGSGQVYVIFVKSGVWFIDDFCVSEGTYWKIEFAKDVATVLIYNFADKIFSLCPLSTQ